VANSSWRSPRLGGLCLDLGLLLISAARQSVCPVLSVLRHVHGEADAADDELERLAGGIEAQAGNDNDMYCYGKQAFVSAHEQQAVAWAQAK